MHVYLFVSISCSDFLSVFSFVIYIYIYTSVSIFIYLHMYTFVFNICLYNPIYVYYFLYLSGTFLAHVLRPNSFHCCSNFTSHCRSFTSLPQKGSGDMRMLSYFPACIQVQLTYFHIHVASSFRSPPCASSGLTRHDSCLHMLVGFDDLPMRGAEGA